MSSRQGKLRRIPMTVIGGFLGVGKTTLINQLLERGGARYAVLVNDFGSVNIDADLIKTRSSKKIEMQNGCICCSLADGLTSALSDLLDAPQSPEAIIVEASGVSDPWRIAEIGLVERSLILNLVVVLVDVPVFESQVVDPLIGDTVVSQIRRADVVILNKVEMADRKDVSRVRKAITVEAPNTMFIEATIGGIWLEILFDTDINIPLARRKSHEIVHNHHRHDDMFFHESFTSHAPLNRENFEHALNCLPRFLLRLKGWCRFDGNDDGYLLQWVGGRWTLEPDGRAPKDTVLICVGVRGPASDQAIESIFGAIRAASV
jgi:G3E family GTPase